MFNQTLQGYISPAVPPGCNRTYAVLQQVWLFAVSVQQADPGISQEAGPFPSAILQPACLRQTRANLQLLV